MRTINAHQLAEILTKQGNSVAFISIPNKNHGGSIPDAIKHSLEQVQQ
jgi:raw score 9.06